MILSSTRSKCFSVIAPHGQTITIEYDAPGKLQQIIYIYIYIYIHTYIHIYILVDRIEFSIVMHIIYFGSAEQFLCIRFSFYYFKIDTLHYKLQIMN
jgi:hypothetical protein